MSCGIRQCSANNLGNDHITTQKLLKYCFFFFLFPIKDIWATSFLADQIKPNLENVLPTIVYIHSESYKKISRFSKISEMIL